MTHPSTPRALILCADDYALHPLVDDAVEQLTLRCMRCGSLAMRWCMA